MVFAPLHVISAFTFSSSGAARSQRNGPQEPVGPIVWLDAGPAHRHEVGGKAASLSRLMALGAPVPAAFAIPAGAYADFAASLGLPRRAADVDPAGLESIRDTILAAPLPEFLTNALTQTHRAMSALAGPGLSLAVRSSGTSEDSAALSFAGLHDTFLDIRTLADLERAVKACWASLWSDRAHAYRHERGIAAEDTEIAVVVQQLVRSDVSFVAFTADPVTGDDNVVITATWGLGEAVVAGITVPDHITVSLDGTVRDYVAGRKHLMVIPNPGEGTGTVEVPVPRALQSLPALTHSQAEEIARMARDLSRKLGYPADLEGGLSSGTIHLFQARPITTLV